MDFNYLKKRVAGIAAFALATAGMTATVMPAAAAEGDVKLSPTNGTGNTAFSTDDFELDVDIISTLDNTQLAFKIDNPDQNQLAITTSKDAYAFGVKSDGEIVESGITDLSSTGTVGINSTLVVDFETLEITSLVVTNVQSNTNSEKITVQLDNSSSVAESANQQSVTALDTGDLTSATSVTVTSWLETGANTASNHLSVDTEYSDSFEVNFVDPSDVSAIPQIERFAGYNSSNAPNYAVTSVRVATDTDLDSTSFNPGDPIDGVSLVKGDRVLIFDESTANDNGIYTVADTSMTLVDKDVTGLVYVQEGTNRSGDVFTSLANNLVHVDYVATAVDVDTASTGNSDFDTGTLAASDVVLISDDTDTADNGLYTVDAGASALSELDVDFSGPVYVNDGATKAGTIYLGDGTSGFSTSNVITNNSLDAFNEDGDSWLGASLRFSNSNINLAQVDLSKWDYKVTGDASGSTGFIPGSTGLVLKPTTPAGYTEIDGKGRLLLNVPATDASLDSGKTYQLSIRHSGYTSTEYKSNGFQVITAPSSSKTADTLDISVGTTTDAVIGTTYSSGYPVDVRYGTESLTFTAQLDSSDGTTARGANIPVLAVVTAGDNWTTGETLTVSGATEKIASKKGTIITSGLTNSDGQFAVTVTSSDDASSSAKYDVQFYALSSENNDWESDEEDGNSALFKVDYASPTLAAQPDGFGSSTTVASGSSVTLTFDVEDQWGQPLSANAKGKAYSVELQASDDDDLDLDTAVVDGTATFTFDNYVTAGGSDVLTAKLYTGSSTSPSFVSGRTDNITLYNTNAIAGINLTNDEFTGKNVEYTDFFSGKKAAGQKEPSSTNNYTVQGTVVDANGAGVPGAPVTISAEGMAFKADGSSSYAVDSIDVIASAAGAFKVDFWTQEYSEDGVELTVTSGDQSATATVEAGYDTSAIDPGNLRMSWTIDADSQFVMNTTYAVTATVQDVFGNPVEGAYVKYTGLAAAQFNGGTAATRVTGEDGTAVAYLRSIKDVSGLSAVGLELLDTSDDSFTFSPALTATIKDDTKTSWDESLFDNDLSQEINFLSSAADVVATDQKVNAGSFKGYVAVYAKGYEGQRLSAKIGNDWVIVDPIVNNEGANLHRTTDFTGAGVDIAVRIYIDRVLVDTINLTTK